DRWRALAHPRGTARHLYRLEPAARGLLGGGPVLPVRQLHPVCEDPRRARALRGSTALAPGALPRSRRLRRRGPCGSAEARGAGMAVEGGWGTRNGGGAGERRAAIDRQIPNRRVQSPLIVSRAVPPISTTSASSNRIALTIGESQEKEPAMNTPESSRLGSIAHLPCFAV